MSSDPIKGWNHTPPVPLQVSPFFRWPLSPVAMFQWVWNSWFLITERILIVGVAYLSLRFFTPPLQKTRQLEFDWIAELLVRNLCLVTVVAGTLHLYFYTFSRQDKELKYDPRPLMKRGKQFTLGGQTRDNMFWTLASGVPIWTLYEASVLWAVANSGPPIVTFHSSPVWFVLLFLLIPVWESFYFYWIHRFLHVPFLYKHVHSLHHRNVNVGPWSGMSMHPFEHLIFLGSVLVHLVIPSNPVHVLFHLQYYVLTAVTTHTGFEGLVVKDKNRLRLGTFHHQMHHRYFECNYGSLEIPWDKLFGSFHDGTSDAHARINGRRKRLNGGTPQ